MTSFQTKIPSSFSCTTDFLSQNIRLYTYPYFISLAYQPALVSLNLGFCHLPYADSTKSLEASARTFSDIWETIIKNHGDCLPKIVVCRYNSALEVYMN